MARDVRYRSNGLAERLRFAREGRRLTQTELSLRAGLDRKSCFNIENDKGQGNVGLLTVQRLARALEVPPSWLAFGVADVEDRITDLKRELSDTRLAQRQMAKSTADYEPEEAPDDIEQDQADEVDAQQAEIDREARSAAVIEQEEKEIDHAFATMTIWPHGHRPHSTHDSHRGYPPLGRRYAPVLEALGPGLPEEQRRQVSLWLAHLLLVRPEDREAQVCAAAELRRLLQSLVPGRNHGAVELVMRDLESPDLARRAPLAASLIIDGGLPACNPLLLNAAWRALREAGRRETRQMACAANIMEKLFYRIYSIPGQDQGWQLPPGPSQPALAGS